MIRRLPYTRQQSDKVALSYPIHRETPIASRLGKPRILRMIVSSYTLQATALLQLNLPM